MRPPLLFAFRKKGNSYTAPMIVITDPASANYESPGHPERPQRILGSIAYLEKQTEVPVTFESPGPVDSERVMEAIGHAHPESHLQRLENKSGQEDFDGDTPAYDGIYDHARRCVAGGLKALDHCLNGELAFSMLRPPGHHATPTHAMGFCYLSTAAIMTLEARKRGISKVAVFDFDVHHGNGTEDVLMGVEGTKFFSVHQHPCYPGSGQHSSGNCYNYPVPPYSSRQIHKGVFYEVFDELKEYDPELVVVSAGFDAYARDPLANMSLEADDFGWLGRHIRELDIPAVSILEGGYSDDLPLLITAYLRDWEGVVS